MNFKPKKSIAAVLCQLASSLYFSLQFSQMIKLYHSLGPEKFPLNEQTFYPNHTQMVSALPLLRILHFIMYAQNELEQGAHC